MVDQLRAHRDLDPLDRVENEHSQPAAKAIALPHRSQIGTRGEAVRRRSVRFLLPERVEVARQAVLADRPQPSNQLITASRQAARQQSVRLFLEGQGAFRVFHGSALLSMRWDAEIRAEKTRRN